MPTADETLRTLVLQALAANPDTVALGLHVGVLNAVVHLGGEAPSERHWHLAEVVAASVTGVRGVVNRIQAPGAPSPVRTINLPLGDHEGGEA